MKYIYKTCLFSGIDNVSSLSADHSRSNAAAVRRSSSRLAVAADGGSSSCCRRQPPTTSAGPISVVDL